MSFESKVLAAGIGGGGLFFAAGESLGMKDLGAAAIFIVLVLQIILKFLKDSREKKDGVQLPEALKKAIYDSMRRTATIEHGWGEVKDQVRDLHTWHDAEDARGRKLWFGVDEDDIRSVIQAETRPLAEALARLEARA